MQYLIELKDERKKDFLLELLANLDFVRVKPQEIQYGAQDIIGPAEVNEVTEEEISTLKFKDENTSDFTKGIAGLLSAAGTLDRPLDANKLRKAAWKLDK